MTLLHKTQFQTTQKQPLFKYIYMEPNVPLGVALPVDTSAVISPAASWMRLARWLPDRLPVRLALLDLVTSPAGGRLLDA